MLEKAIHKTAQKKTEAAPEQTSRVKMALLIFAYFIKIGSFTFGSGWSILAQMEQEFVDKRRWLTKQELLELVAVGKSLPGIMITNITMLFGYQMAGVLGGVLAVLGIALPAVVVLSLVTLAYDAIKSNYWVWAALQGVQCAVVPIIGGAAISLGKEALKDKASVFICLAALAVCHFTSISNIVLILAGVVAALSPAFTLTLAAAVFFQKFRTSKVMGWIMKVVKPLCIGMILEVLLSLSLNTYAGESGIRFVGIAIGLLCFWLLQKKKMSVPKVIGIAAALGVVGFGVL